MKASGLPIAEIIVYSAETDPNHLLGRPGKYVSFATWHDSRLPLGTERDISEGGDVQIFATAEDAQAYKQYIEAITKSVALLAEYDYQSGVYLLRVSGRLTPDQAVAYQKAFEDAIK